MEETFEGVFGKKDETATTDFMCGDGASLMSNSIAVELESVIDRFYGYLENDNVIYNFLYPLVRGIIYRAPWMINTSVDEFGDLSAIDKLSFINELVGSATHEIATEIIDELKDVVEFSLKGHIETLPFEVQQLVNDGGQDDFNLWQECQSPAEISFFKPGAKSESLIENENVC